MKLRIIHKGSLGKTVMLDNVADESDDEIIDFAVEAADETRDRLYDITVNRFSLTPDRVNVNLHTS